VGPNPEFSGNLERGDMNRAGVAVKNDVGHTMRAYPLGEPVSKRVGMIVISEQRACIAPFGLVGRVESCTKNFSASFGQRSRKPSKEGTMWTLQEQEGPLVRLIHRTLLRHGVSFLDLAIRNPRYLTRQLTKHLLCAGLSAIFIACIAQGES
jgi:hypothetical protein